MLTTTIHHTYPTPAHTLSPPPQLWHLRPLLPPFHLSFHPPSHKLTHPTSKWFEILLIRIPRHYSGQGPTHRNQASSMRAYYYRYILIPNFSIKRGDDTAESVCAAVVHLRQRFTITRGDDRGSVGERVSREERPEGFGWGREGVHKRGVAVPLPKPGVYSYLGKSEFIDRWLDCL